MSENLAVSALGALAHAQRLRVFRAWVDAAGLVTIEQQGCNLICRADFAQMNKPVWLRERALLPGRCVRSHRIELFLPPPLQRESRNIGRE